MAKTLYTDQQDDHPVFHVTELDALGTDGIWLVVRGMDMKYNLLISPRIVEKIVSYSLRHFFVGIPWCLRVIARILTKEK